MAGPAPLLDICPLGVFLRPFGKLDMMAELAVSWFVFPCAGQESMQKIAGSRCAVVATNALWRVSRQGREDDYDCHGY